MAKQIRILDLFCGAGGAAMGLHCVFPEAEIVGVDIEPQPHYPFKFYRRDWRAALMLWSDEFDLIWASPVCKRYTRMTNCRPGKAQTHPDAIEAVRKHLKRIGTPWVIENVPGSPLCNPIMLCGTMFGLELYRHRLFEASFPLTAPTHTAHAMKASRAGHWEPGTVMSVAGHFTPVEHARKIMGIDWMNRDELSQAIPPAYAAYIAGQFKVTALPPPCWHKEIDEKGFCKACGARAAITLNIPKPSRELDSDMDDHRAGQPGNHGGAVVPDCSTCGRPSPDGGTRTHADEYARHLEDTCQG